MVRRVQRWLTLFSIGLLGIISLSVSAQEVPEPEDDPIVVTGTRRITYVASGTDAVTTDIHAMEFRDEVGLIDHDNDPTTPRIIEGESYEVTNITNTPGANEKDPQFLPDGQIAYLGEANPTTYPDVLSVFVVGGDGQEKVQITPDGVNVRNFTFNPDSTQVAFSAMWGSNQIKLYRSDITGENQFTLTPGEGFHADFPLWRAAENGTEITYIRAEGGTSQVAVLDPLTASSRQVTDTPHQKFILAPLNEQYATFIQREDETHDWEVAAVRLDTGEVTQLTDNTTNDCCAVLDANGEGVYYLSDVEGGGRDIYRVNLDGSNPVNLTANDDREYTGVLSSSLFLELTGFDERANSSVDSLFGNSLLVGYNATGDDTPAPRLGLGWGIPDRELQGNYEFQDLTEGSDPDVVDTISLEQLEGLAAAGLLTTVCEMQTESPGAEIYSEPRRESEPVEALIGDVSFVEVNAYLPGTPSSPEGWYHLTNGRWVPESHVTKPDNCPPLPTISPYSLANL